MFEDEQVRLEKENQLLLSQLAALKDRIQGALVSEVECRQRALKAEALVESVRAEREVVETRAQGSSRKGRDWF